MENDDTMYVEGTCYCLTKHKDFFAGKTNRLNKVLFTLERKNVKLEEINRTYDCITELISFGDSVYCIKHTYKGIWTHDMSFLIKSKADLYDVYEYLEKYKPAPTWLTIVEFVKECTNVDL